MREIVKKQQLIAVLRVKSRNRNFALLVVERNQSQVKAVLMTSRGASHEIYVWTEKRSKSVRSGVQIEERRGVDGRRAKERLGAKCNSFTFSPRPASEARRLKKKNIQILKTIFEINIYFFSCHSHSERIKQLCKRSPYRLLSSIFPLPKSLKKYCSMEPSRCWIRTCMYFPQQFHTFVPTALSIQLSDL